MEGVADRKHADNYQSNRQRQNTVQVEEKCTNVGFSRLVEQEWGNKEQHKELGFQVNLLNAGQHERNKQADNNLDNGDGDVDKLVDNRGSRDAGQNNEHKFECLQQASFLVVRRWRKVGGGERQARNGVPSAEQRVRDERRIHDGRRIHGVSRQITLHSSIYGFAALA